MKHILLLRCYAINSMIGETQNIREHCGRGDTE